MKNMLPVMLSVLALLIGKEAVAGEKPAQPPSPAASAAIPSQRVDVNRASVAELLTVPGIGPRMAQAIVDLRSQMGSFATLDDLLQVRGIKEKTLKAITPYLALLTPPPVAKAPVR